MKFLVLLAVMSLGTTAFGSKSVSYLQCEFHYEYLDGSQLVVDETLEQWEKPHAIDSVEDGWKTGVITFQTKDGRFNITASGYQSTSKPPLSSKSTIAVLDTTSNVEFSSDFTEGENRVVVKQFHQNIALTATCSVKKGK